MSRCKRDPESGKAPSAGDATADTARPSRARANYGANENRRTCPACGSAESTVEGVRQTGRLIVRYRECRACRRRRTTQEIVATV